MRRLADLLRDPEVTTDDLSCGDTEMLEGLSGGQVEYSMEGYLVAVQRPWEQTLKPDRQSVTEVMELGDGAWTRRAQIEDREAVWWVKTAAVDAGTFAAERVVPAGRHMPKRLATKCDMRGGGDLL
jgi:hypothetical protein